MLLRSLVLTGTIQGLFLILLLKTKKKSSHSDKLLMLWLGIMAVQLLFYYDNLSSHPLAPDYLQLLGFSLPLISSPALYLYIYSLSSDSTFQWRRVGIHLLPYMLFNGIVFCFSAHITISNGFPHFREGMPAAIAYFLTILLAIIPGYYTVLSLVVLLKYQKRLPDNYSYTEEINLNWLKWVVISLLLLFVTLFLIIKYGVKEGLLTYQNLFAVVGSILSCYIFFIGYFGLRQTNVFTDMPVATHLTSELTAKANYKNSGLDDGMADRLFQKLKRHMEENKPFLDEDLSLATLARQIDTTPNQLSQVINQKSSSNFFTFINGYRVEAVKEKLSDPAYGHYSILAIGFECGFRSKSSFNKIFKDIAGKTPSQYQKP